MKKLLSTLVALPAFTFLLWACSKSPDKVLDKKDGKWDVVVTTVVIFQGAIAVVPNSRALFY